MCAAPVSGPWAISKTKRQSTVLGEALGGDESYYVAVAAARALAHIGGDKPYDILRASISRTSWQEVIAASIFHGFAQAKEKRAVELAINHSKYGERAPIRVAAIACLGALGKELNKEKKDDQVVDHLIELLKDKAVRAPGRGQGLWARSAISARSRLCARSSGANAWI